MTPEQQSEYELFKARQAEFEAVVAAERAALTEEAANLTNEARETEAARTHTDPHTQPPASRPIISLSR